MALFGHRGFGTEPMDVASGANSYGFQTLRPSAAQSAQPQNAVQRFLPYIAPGDAYPRGSTGPGLRYGSGAPVQSTERATRSSSARARSRDRSDAHRDLSPASVPVSVERGRSRPRQMKTRKDKTKQ